MEIDLLEQRVAALEKKLLGQNPIPENIESSILEKLKKFQNFIQNAEKGNKNTGKLLSRTNEINNYLNDEFLDFNLLDVQAKVEYILSLDIESIVSHLKVIDENKKIISQTQAYDVEKLHKKLIQLREKNMEISTKCSDLDEKKSLLEEIYYEVIEGSAKLLTAALQKNYDQHQIQ